MADLLERRLGRPPRPDRAFWFAALLVTFIGGALRLFDLSHPPGKIFDEVYYAEEAQDLLGHGVEWDPEQNGPQYVVHPPLGKWMIAVGERLFGYNELGWRIGAAVAGTLSILLLILVAQRLFRSTVLACAAGLLLSLDGMHFVMSRVALLDIFLMFFVLAGFGCLLLDREQRRDRRLRRIAPGVPWWRLGAGLCLGLACGVKWSGIWYVLLFPVLIALWEAGARRSTGAARPWRDALRQEWVWLAGFFAIAGVAYLATWTGWFVSDDGYFRHWYAASQHTDPGGPIDALFSLAHYHLDALRFHTTLTKQHIYQSWPWQWLLLGRPVRFYVQNSVPCGDTTCVADVLMLGTPLLWWSFLPSLFALGWLGIARRDWRVTAIGAGALAAIVPWFWNEMDHRTMFSFYALPGEPFLVLAVVFVLGAIIGPARDPRRTIGAFIAGTYVMLVAACFAYFYPIYTAQLLPSTEWLSRMWLGNRWI